ncbi:uncharacterized protein BEWA_002790 [Theileria equi strain WA]|uniref:Membrane protein, putative n=1 Tax=Theileria equi strain WA TaxID=1537102 RepID=L0AZ58_THEEQ|nr:uncharacterized protein BEWA_002790 [Theileria equi strain WA]AFZ80872.1 membrane protein, putative [Theileria equi strain WA]|eukprot:XP_004830538.1 uncharacterized protein BEWA_002790 [Theileria equi strain WA]
MAGSDSKHKSSSLVDLTRFLDSGILTLFTIFLSCTFLFMFGELLKLVAKLEFPNDQVFKRALGKLFPFRKSYDFNLTHSLLFSLCIILLSLRRSG